MHQALARFQISSLAWRLAFLYAALFFVVGCYLPYMPVWLKWRGLSDDAIAFLLATPLFCRVLFTPTIAFAADWTGSRRTILMLLAWGSLLGFVALWASGSFWQMFLAILVLALNWPTLMPLIETIAMGGMRNSGLDYGKVRLWGSGSFILASFGCGLLIGAVGAASVLPVLVVFSALTVVGVHFLPRELARQAGTASAPRRLKLSDAASLVAAIDGAMPGDVILLADGTYDIDANLRCDAPGTADQPIVVRAVNRHMARVRSSAVEGFLISEPHWHVEDLDIEGVCAAHSDCEHAFHVVGGADSTVIRGNRVHGFNAQIKGNGAGDPRIWPDDVLVEGNESAMPGFGQGFVHPLLAVDGGGGADEAGQLDDGRWMLVNVGVERLRVVEWLPDDPFPQARVERLTDDIGGVVDDQVSGVETLLRRALAMSVELGDLAAPLELSLAEDPVQASFEAAATAPIGPLDAQRLLEVDTAAERLSQLEALLTEECAVLELRLSGR